MNASTIMEYLLKKNSILPKEVVSAIALGSNLGDSLFILEAAIQTLVETPQIKLLAKSNWYQTKPVGPPQPDYLNGCILLQVQMIPDLANSLICGVSTRV